MWTDGQWDCASLLLQLSFIEVSGSEAHRKERVSRAERHRPNFYA